jgi:hypothetical protein
MLVARDQFDRCSDLSLSSRSWRDSGRRYADGPSRGVFRLSHRGTAFLGLDGPTNPAPRSRRPAASPFGWVLASLPRRGPSSLPCRGRPRPPRCAAVLARFAVVGSISLRSSSCPRSRIQDGVPVSRVGNVEIVVADERARLAMKMRASLTASCSPAFLRVPPR